MRNPAYACLAMLFAIVAHAEDFQGFANKSSQAMQTAYEKRDVKTYRLLLTDFQQRYNSLSAAERKNYAGYLWNGYYNLSCAYSLLDRKKEAFIYLDSSIRAGYNDYKHMQEDADLDNIRHEPRFTALVEPTRRVSDYLFILRNAGAYNAADNRAVPRFTYMDASNEHLAALRKAFNLDSVAGKGADYTRILSMLHWMHNLVPHDGQHGNPDVMNAMNMVAVCKRDVRGLNCRGLATVLNECYLAMGFKSRFVTCLPKDSLKTDNDCHVINMVFVPSLKKWIWVDPTNDAYVMDEKGNLLGVEEVREKIVNDRPLVLNADANWNHREEVIKSYYLYKYMAKNLYMLECPVSSEWDTETRAQGKTITYARLMPLDYYDQKKDRTEFTNKTNGTTFITYYTNNPSIFWAKP